MGDVPQTQLMLSLFVFFYVLMFALQQPVSVRSLLRDFQSSSQALVQEVVLSLLSGQFVDGDFPCAFPPTARASHF